MTTWNLDPLYTGFDTEDFLKDMTGAETAIEQLKDWNPPDGSPADTLCAYLEIQEPLMLLLDRLMRFCELTYTADTAHADAQKYQTRLEELQAGTAKPEALFHAFVGALPDPEAVIASRPFLQEHRFYLLELHQTARYLLDPDTEALTARLRATGSASWELLHSLITSDLMVTVPLPEGEKTLPLAEVRNLASSPDAAVRKAAYRAEVSAYPAIAPQAAMALNCIKGEVLTMGSMRGYPSPLEEALIHSRMKPSTLACMMDCLTHHLPLLESMFLKKARLMGHPEGLPFYDLFAPLGHSGKTYSQTEAQGIILKHFGAFSADLEAFARTAFENRWVDWLPRKGKVGGAFCSYSHSIEESRILTNFTGTFEDITTLAHELGHGYHDRQLTGLPFHGIHYPMPLAETASIFCETLISNALMAELPVAERPAMLEMRLQMIGQVLTDIYSRYLFEEELFQQRQDFALQPDELCSLMLECQRKAYGKGLAPDCMHPYMWVCKPHYYSAGLSFYNFPYAFGLLFSTGLYAQYLKEGAAFVPKYRSLLRQTGSLSVEDTARLAGIELETPDFWKQAFRLLAEEIETFLNL